MPPAGKGTCPFAIPLLSLLRQIGGVVFSAIDRIWRPLRGGGCRL